MIKWKGNCIVFLMNDNQWVIEKMIDMEYVCFTTWRSRNQFKPKELITLLIPCFVISSSNLGFFSSNKHSFPRTRLVYIFCCDWCWKNCTLSELSRFKWYERFINDSWWLGMIYIIQIFPEWWHVLFILHYYRRNRPILGILMWCLLLEHSVTM